MRSLGLRTDLLALSGLAEIERYPGHVVVRTPAEPDYWSGNGLILLGPPGDPEAETALFRRHFPMAAHVSPVVLPTSNRSRPWVFTGMSLH